MTKPYQEYPADLQYIVGKNDSFYKALADSHAITIDLRDREIRRLKRQALNLKADAMALAIIALDDDLIGAKKLARDFISNHRMAVVK